MGVRSSRNSPHHLVGDPRISHPGANCLQTYGMPRERCGIWRYISRNSVTWEFFFFYLVWNKATASFHFFFFSATRQICYPNCALFKIDKAGKKKKLSVVGHAVLWPGLPRAHLPTTIKSHCVPPIALCCNRAASNLRPVSWAMGAPPVASLYCGWVELTEDGDGD